MARVYHRGGTGSAGKAAPPSPGRNESTSRSPRGGERGMDVQFTTNPVIDSEQLNLLFSAAWPAHVARDFSSVLARSLAYVCAFAGDQPVGFVNLAWDGGAHAFLLDPTVHPDFQRRGIGKELIRMAVSIARQRGVEWLHVDYESSLGEFYRQCGFRPTAAGLIEIKHEARHET